MPIIIVGKLEIKNSTCLFDVSCLERPYPQFSIDTMNIRCFLNRVYTKNGKITLQPKKTFVFTINKPEYGSASLDLSPYALYESVPKDYWVEILATNFVLKRKDQSGRETATEFPIYPKEMKLHVPDYAPYTIKERIQKEMKSLDKIGEAFETVGSLYQSDFNEIASDLTEGLLRTERNDHEGAIKFFRKVVEALRDYVGSPEVTIISDNRTDLFKRFLSSSYSLLANFGEHAGTHGWIDESTLSKEVTIATIRYVLSALK